ncbi:MAG: hypothetical protein KKB20_18615, partial [Proteobacteria bacterium]|nr:hypothetical protein [Pseudomonadota bacterium]
KGTSGLTTKVDPARLEFTDPRRVQERILPFLAGINILIDPTGRAGRRKGYSQAGTGDFRDLFSSGGTALCVKDDELCLLGSDLATTALRPVTPGARMSYAAARGKVFWSNGFENGYVRHGMNFSWEPEPHDERDVEEDTVFAASVPLGHLLEWFNGRMLIGQEEVVWHSERFYPGLYPLSRRQLHLTSRVRMIQRVSGGVWISDEGGIHWLGGMDPAGWDQDQKADYPAIEGAVVKVPGSRTGFEALYEAGLVVLVMTTRGVCLAGPDGFFANLTEERIEHDKSPWPFRALAGAAVVIGDQAVFTLEP